MSKQLRGFLAALLGLAALVVLGLALMALFGGQGGLPVAQEPPQPTPPGTQWTYPLGHTPQPTGTPVPPVGAYPLPTSGPTITPWPTETPWPTPDPPPPPQPVGLQVVWVERATDEVPGLGEAYTFYAADVGDINNRKVLYTTPPCRGVEASLSPDGSAIAFTTYAGSHPESGGTLWVLRLGESQPRELTQGMHATRRWCWSRDSRLLAYVRCTPRQSPPPDKESFPTRPELHAISVDRKEDKLLFAEDDVSPSPLGWTPEGQLLYTLSGDRPDIKRGLWSLDIANGVRTFIMELPEHAHLRLSPDGRRLLIQGLKEVFWLSADGRHRRRIDFPGIMITSTPSPGIPLAPTPTTWAINVSWAGNSSEVIFKTGPGSWRIGNLDTGTMRDISVAPPPPGVRDDLMSVSPDGQWLAMSWGLTLLKANERFQITVVGFGVPYRFVGWLPAGSFDGGIR